MRPHFRFPAGHALTILLALLLLAAGAAEAAQRDGNKKKRNKKNKQTAEQSVSAQSADKTTQSSEKKKNKQNKKQADGAAQKAQEAAAPKDCAESKPLPAPLDRPDATRQLDRLLWAWETESAREAVETTEKANAAEVDTALGRVLMQENQLPAAAERLRAAAATAANDPAPLIYLGETLRLSGDTAGASDAFRRAVDRARVLAEGHPDNAQANYWHGVALLWSEQPAAAAEALEKARERAPDDPMTAYHLGLARASQERWSDAVEQLDRALAANDSIALAYYYRGLSHGRLNRKDLMAADLERFLRLAPDSPEAPKARRILSGV